MADTLSAGFGVKAFQYYNSFQTDCNLFLFSSQW